MKTLNHYWQQWDHWWFRSCPPHVQALFRIAFGSFLIVEALTYLPSVVMLFSNEGLAVPLFDFLGPPPRSIAWLIYGLYLSACLLLTLGFLMRTSLTTLILLYTYYWHLSFYVFPSSYHRLFFIVLCALLLSGADKTYSLRMKITHGSWMAWEPVSIFAQRLLSVQIAVTYAGVGWQKLWLPAWQDGAALSYSLVARWATPVGRWVVQQNLPFWMYSASVDIITFFECMIPICLWMRRWRLFFMLFGTSFHIGIAVLMSIWWFVVLIPAYIVFFSPEEVHGYLKKRGFVRNPSI